jgi:pantoate--beta-alanine ligase
VLKDVTAGKLTSDQASSALSKAGWKPDYVEVRRQADLGAAQPGEKKLVVLAAARLGQTRLIDNLEF